MAIVEVAEYNGTPEVFAWKFPSEELGTWTQLVVNESQEAILFKGGQALDVFSAGRHTLETANIPFLNKIINLPFGGRSPFTAEVWYVNKVFSLDVKWGTPTPIQIQDPKYKVLIPIRSFGQFGIQIEDSRKFLVKLVGTLEVFEKNNIVKYFRGLYLTKVKDSISSYLVHNRVSVLEINAYLDKLSEHLKEKMTPVMEEYGIKLVNFYINDINIPETDSAVIKLKEALSKRAEMDIVGYNYIQQRSFDTLEGAVTNESTGQAGFMGAGLGLGMGLGMGNAIGPKFGGLAEGITVKGEMKNCPRCSSLIEKSKRFCSECGYDTEDKFKENKIEIICSSCGTKYNNNSKFCPECGDSYNPCPYCKSDLKVNEIICPECGRPLPKSCSGCGALLYENFKYCPECGMPLIKKCSNCSSEIKGFSKFCPECGNKVE
ncbi:SPFH domain-containing protein [Clostridium polynesiense]|uniref:SPFH domain-containing protein n=1 Tax=Clostridium polynesiense TaxID=1325933 RepID=UPI00058F03AB|nr:SPFH domain-containing protein [Clostridium polynesiense]